jgi:hypothetical protein
MNLLYHGGQYQWIRYKTYANTEGKLMARLTDFHRQQLLGVAAPSVVAAVDVPALYIGAPTVDAAPLVAPFLEPEACAAVRAMNRNNSPDPDDFGSGFYSVAWGTVSTDIFTLARAFHERTAELDRLNRAYVVMIPKHAAAVEPGDYRRICLQNCSLKIIEKMMTTWLQRDIPRLIDVDQIGFIKGRSISENFIYALELVQCCNRRKLPTLVLKLDFAKAFYSVDWACLARVMEVCGFPEQWCRWIASILETSKLVVLVNGNPGPWFNCKRGLRQGGPLSPYLFLLVADVLQMMIKQEPRIKHPAAADLPCPVLQYVDDTLILLAADSQSLIALKDTLDSFSAASGLRINFDKSTMVPMHTPPADVEAMKNILGCKVEGFPQSYLGLPLSNDKLRLSAFSPLIAKADRYLAGWQAALLNHMGRAVLVNSVLDSQLIYTMSALQLPQGVLDALDRKRRSFLWAGDNTASGAQCLLAWGKACQPKEQGGLGIKDLAAQNNLLLKLLHRLHHPGGSAWARWVRGRVDLVTMRGAIGGVHWKHLEELLPLYRAITVSVVCDGQATDFWKDRWLSWGRLYEEFPPLFLHAVACDVSVAAVVSEGIDAQLVPRISRGAAAELQEVRRLLARVVLTEGADRRSSAVADGRGTLRSGPVYDALMEVGGAPPPPPP